MVRGLCKLHQVAQLEPKQRWRRRQDVQVLTLFLAVWTTMQEQPAPQPVQCVRQRNHKVWGHVERLQAQLAPKPDLPPSHGQRAQLAPKPRLLVAPSLTKYFPSSLRYAIQQAQLAPKPGY